MKIDYTGRGTEVTPALRAALEKRLKKAESRVGEIAHVHAIFTVQKNRQGLELVCKIGRKQYIAKGESADMYASVEAATEALLQQLRKVSETSRDVRRQSTARRRPAGKGVAPAVEPAGAEDEAPTITRVSQPALKPMSLKMAILLLASRPEPVLVYTSVESGRLAVLFRREAGGLGLIEP